MINLKKVQKFFKNPYTLFVYLSKYKLLDFINDEQYLKLIYRGKFNKKLNLQNPITYNEKLQWLKLNDRNPLYTSLVDKYEVREYISDNIGQDYLIPLIGVYNSFDEINFDKLPQQFVLKCTHDSGGLVICKDKYKLDKEMARKKINKSLKRNYYKMWREWPYKHVKPMIICEKYMIDESGTDLKDYKFMCFNGSVKCILVCSERASDEGVKMNFYDEKWNRIKCKRPNHPNSIDEIQKPKNLEKMIELCEKLSKDMPFIRVDFYEINGHIYFGELTFYPAAGFDRFEPDVYDEILGNWLKLPEKI